MNAHENPARQFAEVAEMNLQQVQEAARLAVADLRHGRDLSALIETANAQARLDHAKFALVQRAHVHGESWAAIGEALGITRQAAWERYADKGQK